MLGQMMHRPLSVIEILKFASENHKSAEIVSVRTEGDIHRYSYAQAFERVAQMAHALAALGSIVWLAPGARDREPDLFQARHLCRATTFPRQCAVAGPSPSQEQNTPWLGRSAVGFAAARQILGAALRR